MLNLILKAWLIGLAFIVILAILASMVSSHVINQSGDFIKKYPETINIIYSETTKGPSPVDYSHDF